MSKTVVIKEDGTSKTETGISVITTQLVGSTSANWVPEDETLVGEISITGNGEYVPYSGGIYGFYKVNVNVPGGTGAEQDRTRLPSGTQTVDIPGAQIVPIDTSDYGVVSNVEIPSPSGIGATPLIGGTIRGIDPTDGNTYDYEVQPDGTISKELVEPDNYPTQIQVVTKPIQSRYRMGEVINYDGIVVVAMDADGKVFTDEDGIESGGVSYGPYIDGVIPFNELVFPRETVTKEEYSDGQGIHAIQMTLDALVHDTGGNEIPYCSIPIGWFQGEYIYFASLATQAAGATFMMTIYNDKLYVGKNSTSLTELETVDGVERDRARNLQSAYLADTDTFQTAYGPRDWLSYIPISEVNPNGVSIDGLVPSTSIPVQWESPYDGAELETSFMINVVPDDEE